MKGADVYKTLGIHKGRIEPPGGAHVLFVWCAGK